MKHPKLYFPILDNGCGTGRIGWAVGMIAAAATILRKYDLIIDPRSYPYPDGNANIATQDFLETDCDKLVFIDIDVVIDDPKKLDILLSHDVGVVGGIVPKKKPGLEYSIIPLESDPDPFSGDTDLCEVYRVCRGCMIIKREVFEILKDHPEVTQYTCLETGRLQWEFWRNIAGGTSDDFNFCKRYRDLGGKVYVDRRCTLFHDGNVRYPIKGTY